MHEPETKRWAYLLPPHATGRAAKNGALASKAASTSPKATGNIGKAPISTPTGVGWREIKTEPKRKEPKGPTPARGSNSPAKRRRVGVKEEIKVEGHEGSGSGASMTPDVKPVGKRIGACDSKAGKQRQQQQQQKQGKKKKPGEEGEHGSDRQIPQRLAEKAKLIIQVMDALYPEPPIPINHVVSCVLLFVELLCPFSLPHFRATAEEQQ